MNGYMLSILIPTYNRAEYLDKNLKQLIATIQQNGFADKVELLVSNNCSQDQTEAVLDQYRSDVTCYRQKGNVGLEGNALFLLRSASGKYVMYLGDDDFLPDGYLKKIETILSQDEKVACILPGIYGLLPDGTRVNARDAKYVEKIFRSGFYSQMKLAQYGHQLSGVVLRRDCLLENYTKEQDSRNIYPFIYFVAFNAGRGNTWYLPGYKVDVSVGNEKDWKYDPAGLLPDMLANFKILFPKNVFKRTIICNVVMVQQCWRLRIGDGFSNFIDALKFMYQSTKVDGAVKLFLPLTIILICLDKIASKLKKTIMNIRKK